MTRVFVGPTRFDGRTASVTINYARQGQEAARDAGRTDIVDAIQTSLDEFLTRED